MDVIKRSNFKSLFLFYFNNKLSAEILRFSECLDIEISDKNKKKNPNIDIFGFQNKKNKNFDPSNILKDKADLVLFINSLKKGISVKYLLKSYHKIKEDLLEIVKYKNKDRLLILIKGKNIEELFLFPFKSKYWLKNCSKLILNWHKIYL
jgi:hypothetical protein